MCIRDRYDLWFLAVLALDFPADQQVEFLVGAAELHISLEGHRIISLHQRVEKFVNRDGEAGFEPLGEVISFQQPGHGVFGSQLDDVKAG
jgi:hypothetical protein